ncbi:MAG: tetratricopeptide repeat-containing sensor histidine kinase [Rhizobacter sp.]|nr:tetratricopeptide repeat-containing sensor histidine kinase [Chlorobiales bacterium]
MTEKPIPHRGTTLPSFAEDELTAHAGLLHTDLLQDDAQRTEPTRIDGIEAKLSEIPNTPARVSERVDLLNELAWQLRNINAKRAVDVAAEAYQLAQSADYSKGIAYSLRNVGVGLYLLANYKASLQNLNEALEIFEASGEKSSEAGTLNWIGSVRRQLGEYTQALECFTRSLQIFESLGNLRGAAIVQGSIGNVYNNVGDHEKALTHARLSLQMFEAQDDHRGVATALGSIGGIYERLGNYEQSLAYLLKGLPLCRESDDKRGEARMLNMIGRVHTNLGDAQEAFDYYLKSLQLREDINDRQGEAISLSCIADVCRVLGDPEQSLSYYLRSLMIREDIGDVRGEAESLAGVATVYQSTGDFQQAAEYYRSSLKKYESIGDKEGEAKSLIGLGGLITQQVIAEKSLDQTMSELFTNKAEPEKALEYLTRALATAEEIKTKPQSYKAHKALAEYFKVMGDTAAALTHYEKFNEIKEEVFSDEANSKLTSLQTGFAIEKSEREAELQRKEAELYRLRSVELAEANTQLRDANELKMELLGIAAHDLRNPLSTILSFVELIRESPDDRELADELTDAIHKSAERMLGLIKDLLDTAAMEGGKLMIHPEPLDLALLAQEVVKENTPRASQKDQTMTLRSEPAPKIFADPNRLREVLDNFISNAIKYSQHGKKIEVSVRPSEARVRIEIKDEGQGLSEDDMTKLFGKFQRLSARPTDGESSSGLGLSIVKQLVELHGGTVWAESKGKGTGTVFIAEFPEYRP